ncbi:MAG: phosphonate metabolism protein/1,5-bisphosphokinase (PRPP-forming) PhnN, partial [Betaproteobacteria bacterium]|nr:phosphonate metabolism protein/1,5-bisphosphokinase (PRPP-forming) PhnN [Betaproteobacteria bacterium]
YGFHATLKPPFRLAAGTRAAELIDALDQWCATQRAFVMPPLALRRLGDFMALVPAQADPRLDALREEVTRRFERFAALPDAEELERRRLRPLTPQFHLSLTGPLANEAPCAFSPPAEPLVFDGICVFEEPERDAPFHLLHRAPFRSGGRLIYVVGPSGAGKDTVLSWVKQHLTGGAPVMFARRAITRPAFSGGEAHLPMTPEEFFAAQAHGDFAMWWRANGQCYGIGTEIRTWLASGLTVVVSGSREYLPNAMRDFPDLEVAMITAPQELLRARLLSRGREHGPVIEQRLAREFAVPAARIALELVNDDDPARAGRVLLQHILSPH